MHGADLCVDCIARVDQHHHAASRGIALRHPVVVVDEPGDGHLHLDEGAGELRHLAKGEFAREILRRGEQQRNDGDHRPARVGDPGQSAVLADDRQPTGHDAIIGLSEAAPLAFGSTQERHALGVLPEPHERESENSLRLVLAREAGHERSADVQHQPRHQSAVGHSRQDHVGRDREIGRAEANGDGAADGPEDADERGSAGQGREQTDGEVHQRLGGPARIVRNAILGIGGLRMGDCKMIVPLAREPGVQEAVDDPGAPPDLQRLARDDDADPDGGHAGNDQREHQDRYRGGLRILAFERIEEPAVPAVECHGGGKAQKQEAGQAQGQHPSRACAVAPPEAA